MCEWTDCPGANARDQPLPLEGSQTSDAEPLPLTSGQLLPSVPGQVSLAEPLTRTLSLTSIERSLPCSPMHSMADHASKGKKTTAKICFLTITGFSVF